MVMRLHASGDRRAWVDLSPCGAYRYALGRRWAPGPGIAFVLLNPSRADAEASDPTLARCAARARRLGFGALRVVNLFGWRSPDPAALRTVPDPVGPGNDAALLRAADWAGAVLCGWGGGGALGGRDATVLRLLGRRRLWHLGLTAGGQPRHPLYLRNDVAPQVWRRGCRTAPTGVDRAGPPRASRSGSLGEGAHGGGDRGLHGPAC